MNNWPLDDIFWDIHILNLVNQCMEGETFCPKKKGLKLKC